MEQQPKKQSWDKERQKRAEELERGIKKDPDWLKSAKSKWEDLFGNKKDDEDEEEEDQ